LIVVAIGSGTLCDINSTILTPTPWKLLPNIQIDNLLKSGGLTSACANVYPNIANKDDRIVFVSDEVFTFGYGCGACLSVTAFPSLTTSVLRVTDRIGVDVINNPHIEVSQNQFNILSAQGAIDFITWEVVPCPLSITGGDIQYSFTQGSTVSSSEIVIQFATTPIADVQVDRKFEGFYQLGLSLGAWPLPQGLQSLPFTCKVTSITGEQVSFVVDTIHSDATILVPTSVQFAESCEPSKASSSGTSAPGSTNAPGSTTVPGTTNSPTGDSPTTTGSQEGGAFVCTIAALSLMLILLC